MSERPRKVVLAPRFEAELKPVLADDPKAEEAWRGFCHAVVRIPEMGMAVPGRSGFYSRPVHTERGSYLILYTFDDKKVVCVGLRAIPSTAF